MHTEFLLQIKNDSSAAAQVAANDPTFFFHLVHFIFFKTRSGVHSDTRHFYLFARLEICPFLLKLIGVINIFVSFFCWPVHVCASS